MCCHDRRQPDPGYSLGDMGMKIDKVKVCMNGVNAVKDCARNIGMVCENCGFLEESFGFGGYRNYCRKIESDTPRDGFCYLFHFRDEKACAEFWNKCMEKIDSEDAELLG
jgi:hypothetical protein